MILVACAPPLRSQDPELLEVAGLRSDHIDGPPKSKVIVMSERFSFQAQLGESFLCDCASSMLLKAIRHHQHDHSDGLLAVCAIYTPNEFEKGFCGVGQDADRWTDATFPCRG